MLIQIGYDLFSLGIVCSRKVFLLLFQIHSSLIFNFGELLFKLELEIQKFIYDLSVHFFQNIVINFVKLVNLIRVIWIDFGLVILLLVFIVIGLVEVFLFGVTSFVN